MAFSAAYSLVHQHHTKYQTDDGQLISPPMLAWSKVSGAAPMAFGNSTVANTTATFSAAGSYVLRLSASDGQFTASDDITVNVQAAPKGTPPPSESPTFAMPANCKAAFITRSELRCTVLHLQYQRGAKSHKLLFYGH
jgi:hypothetical protein